ncbi:MAG: mechanosensitive ion channel domain-containing protein, partial [Thiohalorhabdus sp.]|uniref:mechanosensitive ion channel domain-containing protein n=1 Tax=Thiohalorhabdus sp. TaxID=3094134 RepID=UPI002FC2AFC6
MRYPAPALLGPWLAAGLLTAVLLLAGTAGAQEPSPPSSGPAAESAPERAIWERGASPLAPDTLATARQRLAAQGQALITSLTRLSGGGPAAGTRWVLGVALLIGLAAGWAFRHGARAGIDRLSQHPAGPRRLALATGILTALRERAFSLAVPLALLVGLEGLHARDTLIGTLAVAALGLFAIQRLAIALFPVIGRPTDPAGLARHLDDPPVSRLWHAGRLLLALTLAGVFLLVADDNLDPEPELRAVTQFLFSLLVLVVLWRMRDREAWLQVAGGPSASAFRRFLIGGGRAALGIAAVLPALASGLGYQTLSAAILLNLLLTVVILLTVGTLGAGLARAVRRLEAGAPPEAIAPVVTPQRVSRAMRLLGGLIRGTAVGAGLVGVLGVWGFPLAPAWAALSPILFGFQVGSYRISLIALVAAVAVFIGAFYGGRWARRRLLEGVLPRFTKDAGLRNSIASLAYYVVLVLGVLLAISVAGFDLTNLAIIAGALSVGIGFGLQNVVNNFVSGLILLFERPIRVGDVIDYQGQWAVVQEIKVRSTVVQTYDRSELIVPNSELVSNTVTNWTHSSQLARVVIDL